jgi:hypothetical protein
MTMTRLRLAAAALALAALPGFAEDAKTDAPKSSPPPTDRAKIATARPSPYHPAGTVVGKVKSVSAGGNSGGTISLASEVIEPSRSSRGRSYMKRVDKDIDFELAEDVKFRFGFRPKSPAPPDNLQGYKAEASDVHAGQIVKLTLGKKAPPGANLSAVKPVVTMVTIETDAPAPRESAPKKKS